MAKSQNESIEAQKKAIQAQIDRIKESNKTPEELMADLLEQMANLG
jgi:hypothetical protein